MAPVTTRGIKPFTWSYSRLKNFEACPKKHYHVDIAKDVKEPKSAQLEWGDTLHKGAAERLSEKKPLPPTLEPILEPWCKKLESTPGTILVEQKLAITADFGPCDFFAPNVWFRAVIDVLKMHEDIALVLDWKTGKILEDSCQLALAAQVVFAHFPNIKHVRSEFIWLQEEGATTREDFSRDDMAGLWRALWPRVSALEQAHKLTEYPARPGRLCRRWCPVTSCPHHGK